MAANIWNPRAALGIDLTENNFTCLGHTTRNLRCGNHIPPNDVDSASRMLDRIAQMAPGNSAVEELLREVAMSTHCRRNHRSDFNTNLAVRRWMAMIDDMRNGRPGATHALNAARQPGFQTPQGPLLPAVNGQPEIAAIRGGVHNLNIDPQPPRNAFEQAEANFRLEFARARRMREQAALEAEGRAGALPRQEPVLGPQRGFFLNRNHHPPALNPVIPSPPALPVLEYSNFSPFAGSPNLAVRGFGAPPGVRLDPIRNPQEYYRHLLAAVHRDPPVCNPSQNQTPVRRKSLTGGCPICYEKIEHLHDADWCQGTCGQNMHKRCMREWLDTKYGAGTYDFKEQSIECCFCRGEWIWDRT